MTDGMAVDLEGTKLAVARIAGGRIAGRRATATRAGDDADRQPGLAIDLLAGIGWTRGAPMGPAVAGRAMQSGRWMAVNEAALPAIENAPLAEPATARVRPLRLGNDALAAALAEAAGAPGTMDGTFADGNDSTGVGGGVLLAGAFLIGADGPARHVVFTSSHDADGPCGSGRRGTVESVAGARAIASDAAARGHAMDARGDFAAADAGDGRALAPRDRSGRAVATMLADLRAAMGVGRAALGGGIGPAPVSPARVTVHLAGEPPKFHPVVAAARLGGENALLGALRFPRVGAST